LVDQTATTWLETLALHDALPISGRIGARHNEHHDQQDDNPPWTASPRSLAHSARLQQFLPERLGRRPRPRPLSSEISYSFSYIRDRKSTRLNSSHVKISYAVFCL